MFPTCSASGTVARKRYIMVVRVFEFFSILIKGIN